MGLRVIASGLKTVVCFVGLLIGLSAFASAQELRSVHPADVEHGKALYKQGCIVCHGAEGKGAPQTSTES